MSNLLYLSSSIFAEQGNSSQLADNFIRQWQSANPQGQITHLDLTSTPLPQLDQNLAGAFFTEQQHRSVEQQTLVARSDALIAELKAADIVVIGLPMYNFGVPSQFKSWVDHIARAGITFKYTEQGAVGLLSNKPVLVFAARGGRYANTGNDHQEPFLRQFFGFIGLNDVRFIFAEGVNMGEEAKNKALSDAQTETDLLVKTMLKQATPQPA